MRQLPLFAGCLALLDVLLLHVFVRWQWQIGSVLLLLLVAFAAFLFNLHLLDWVQFQCRGYSVHQQGQNGHQLIYREKGAGSLELFADACTDDKGGIYFVVTVPSQQQWQRDMPTWAHNAREQIMTRVTRELGTSYFYYLGWRDNETRITKERHPQTANLASSTIKEK